MGRHKKRSQEEIRQLILELENYADNKQLSLKEVAAIIGIKDSRVRQLILKRKLKADQIGQRTKFVLVVDLKEYVKNIL